MNLPGEDGENKGVIRLSNPCNVPQDASYLSYHMIDDHIKDLQVLLLYIE